MNEERLDCVIATNRKKSILLANKYMTAHFPGLMLLVIICDTDFP